MSPSSITSRKVTIVAHMIQSEPAFLRSKQLETRAGLSRSTIYQYINDGAFPKPVPLGPRAAGGGLARIRGKRAVHWAGQKHPERPPAGSVITRQTGCTTHRYDFAYLFHLPGMPGGDFKFMNNQLFLQLYHKLTHPVLPVKLPIHRVCKRALG